MELVETITLACEVVILAPWAAVLAAVSLMGIVALIVSPSRWAV